MSEEDKKIEEGKEENSEPQNDSNEVKDNIEKPSEEPKENSDGEEMKNEDNVEESKKEKSEPEEKTGGSKPEEKMNKKGKEGSWTPFVIVMGLSLVIAFSWDKLPWLKDAVHRVLDPSAGALLNWNLTVGMLIIVLVINLIVTLIQKYATDQKALRELKKEQKILQEEMKKYRDHPEKMAELSKKQFAFFPKTMKLTSRAIMFTGVPFILFFRWFNDVFTSMEATAGAPIKFFGFLSWFLFYLIFTMIFSGILRKWLKVV